MPYLINPAGRLVAVDEIDLPRWLETPGFRRPTVEEEKEFVTQRTTLSRQVNHQEGIDNTKGVYLATVSQGGKDGYGVASSKILSKLQAQGVNISTNNAGQKIAMLFHSPYSIARLEAPYRILYTMFESTKIPHDWKEYMDMADLVITPSRWCQKVFAEAGVKSKVVPLGYDENVFTYRPRINKRDSNQDFVFLHYNAFNARKGFLEVFKAFNKAFDKDEPVRMVFKTTLEYNPLPITKDEYPKIDIIRGKISEKELTDILYDADCFVYPSRGEGFGMTPLEAMATGLPTIVPNAHGISEYFDEEYMYEVKVESECPPIYAKYKDQDVGKMSLCSVDDLARQMRYIYEHQDEARAKGREAAEYVKNWTFTKTAEKLKAIFDGAEKLNLTERPLKNTLNLEVI
jgi:glycosyltransferase involved in cell wall biosynthesis